MRNKSYLVLSILVIFLILPCKKLSAKQSDYTLNVNSKLYIYAENGSKYTVPKSYKNIISVTKDGIVTGKKVGTAKLKVTYKGKTKTYTIDVVKSKNIKVFNTKIKVPKTCNSFYYADENGQSGGYYSIANKYSVFYYCQTMEYTVKESAQTEIMIVDDIKRGYRFKHMDFHITEDVLLKLQLSGFKVDESTLKKDIGLGYSEIMLKAAINKDSELYDLRLTPIAKKAKNNIICCLYAVLTYDDYVIEVEIVTDTKAKLDKQTNIFFRQLLGE